MKKLLFISLLLLFTSCYTTRFVVGEGAKGNNEIRLKQTHLVNGLISFDIPELKQIIEKSKAKFVKTENGQNKLAE